jgi:GT2 family glycosyltransferase
MISICIPSYHSLEYLKILIPSIRKNTRLPYEILIHVNGTSDGTHKWLEQQKIAYTMSNENLGFCGVNSALKNAKYPYSMIFNSDMYCLPGWDFPILQQITQFKKHKVDRFTISCCLIEPTGNPEYDYFDAGRTAETFDEQRLLNWYSSKQPKKPNTKQFSHPILIPSQQLKEINYLDENYFPGYSSDYDLAKALYESGTHNFVMLGNSRIYHFSSATFSKLPQELKNKSGHDIFMKKWKQDPEDFRKSINIKEEFKMVTK